MKQKFDLSLWLQDKSRKVVTRDGKNVRIICWDRKYSYDNFPIIALEDWNNREYVSFVSSNGRAGSESIHDLFFADEENLNILDELKSYLKNTPKEQIEKDWKEIQEWYNQYFANESNEEEELTDFESDLFTAFSDAWQQYLRGESVDVAKWAKEHSKDLLESARKELKEEYVIIRKDTYESEEKAKTQGLLDNYKKGKQDALQDLPKWNHSDNIVDPKELYVDKTKMLYYKHYMIPIDVVFEKLPKEE